MDQANPYPGLAIPACARLGAVLRLRLRKDAFHGSIDQDCSFGTSWLCRCIGGRAGFRCRDRDERHLFDRRWEHSPKRRCLRSGDL